MSCDSVVWMVNIAGIWSAECRCEMKMETLSDGMESPPTSKIASAPKRPCARANTGFGCPLKAFPGEGLIEVTATRVAILTDLAIPADRIDEAKAEEARQRAEARLREKLSDEQVAAVNASLTRALAQLRVKRRRHV